MKDVISALQFKSIFLLLLTAVSLHSFAELEAIDESELAEISGQKGLIVTWEGMRFQPIGLHPVEDPDNPPFPKFVDTANKFAFYGDSTPDGIQELDFWIYIDRITSNPNAANDGDWGIEFVIDATSRQVERRRIAAGGAVANKSDGISNATKQTYFKFAINDYQVNFGPGSRDDERGGTTRYWNISTNSLCPGTTQVGTPDCYARALSFHELAADSFTACAAGSGQCEGALFQELNVWGTPRITGDILVYGRDGSL